MAALRSRGVGDAAEVAAVVLEADGSLVVVKEANVDAAITRNTHAAKSTLNTGQKS